MYSSVLSTIIHSQRFLPRVDVALWIAFIRSHVCIYAHKDRPCYEEDPQTICELLKDIQFPTPRHRVIRSDISFRLFPLRALVIVIVSLLRRVVDKVLERLIRLLEVVVDNDQVVNAGGLGVGQLELGLRETLLDALFLFGAAAAEALLELFF